VGVDDDSADFLAIYRLVTNCQNLEEAVAAFEHVD